MTDQKRKRILIFLNGLSAFHLLKNVIGRLQVLGYQIVLVTPKNKILDSFIKKENWPDIQLVSCQRPFIKTFLCLWSIASKEKPSVMVGSGAALAYVGFFKKIPTLLISQDDSTVNPENYFTYPLATNVLLPACCDQGLWENKKINYNGFHQLAYLRPKYFKPDESIIKRINPLGKRVFILHLAEFQMGHGVGSKRISDGDLEKLIKQLEGSGLVFILTKGALRKQFQPYVLPVEPHELFHALGFADLLMTDSPTMASEGAVLGVPSIYIGEYAEKLSYLKEFEVKYELVTSVKRRDFGKVFEKIDQLLRMPNLKERWKNHRKLLLVESEDVVEFFVNALRIFAEKGQL